MGSSDEIASHPLLVQLMDDIKHVFGRAHLSIKSKKTLREKQPVNVSPSEYYSWQVFGKASSIYDTASRLEHAKEFVRVFPSPKGFVRKGITRDKWVEYHLCYFIINLVSIPDLCHLLTNAVFRLGIPERLCTPDSVIKNNWVAETEVPNALLNLNKVVKEHRTLRNLHVHRGQVPKVSELLDDDLFSYLSLATFSENVNPIGLDPNILKQGYRAATKDLQKKMENDLSVVLDAVLVVLNALQPQYLKILNLVRNGVYCK